MDVDVKGTIVSDDEALFYQWYGVTHTSPRQINNAIKQAKSRNETLDVYINSGGGDIFAGSEIYQALKSYSNTKIHVVGLAASAASVIAQAGISDIAETAMFMIHNVSSYAYGDYNDMQHSADVLEKANNAIAQSYISKTGLSEKEILSLMNKETWLTAKEAVEQKFIDKIANNQAAKLVASNNCYFLNAEMIEKAKTLMVDNKNQLLNKNQEQMKMEIELLKLKGRI